MIRNTAHHRVSILSGEALNRNRVCKKRYVDINGSYLMEGQVRKVVADYALV